MTELLGVSVPVFIGLTIVLFGGAAFLTGQSMANAWRPAGKVVLYGLFLGLGNRFLVYALFGGPLLSIVGYVIDTAILVLFALAGYRVTKARKMVCQYPWLYERSGLFGWRDRNPARG
jgi:hypothetical protein